MSMLPEMKDSLPLTCVVAGSGIYLAFFLCIHVISALLGRAPPLFGSGSAVCRCCDLDVNFSFDWDVGADEFLTQDAEIG